METVRQSVPKAQNIFQVSVFRFQKIWAPKSGPAVPKNDC